MFIDINIIVCYDLFEDGEDMKFIKSIITLIMVIVLLGALEIFSIKVREKPIFATLSIDDDNKIYKGPLYDVYFCQNEEAKIVWKNELYECQKITDEKNNIDLDNEVKKEINLTIVGDLLFEQPFYDAIDEGYEKEEYFRLVKDYFTNDDLSIGNMEVVIGNESLKPSGTGYNFCAPKYIGDLVNTLDFEILSTANNHAYDRGLDGIHSTIDYFKNTDILTTGTRKNQDDLKYNVINIKGINVGIISYTYGTNQKPTIDNLALINYYRDPVQKKVTDEYLSIIKNDIETLKSKSDIVIVLMHWGTEFTYNINQEQKYMSEYLNDLGVDIIIGNHSHNIQPIKIIGDEHQTLVYYSLGNFVSHDNDIARTNPGNETFDNAYQVGLLSKLKLTYEKEKLSFSNIDTELIVNYFDQNLNNFKLVPFKEYHDKLEKSHYRYSYGLNKEFITKMYEQVIDEEFR